MHKWPSGWLIALTGWLLFAGAPAQQPQNPSPLVEHTRVHPRLTAESPAGRREPLELGTLFVPAGVKGRAALMVHFHGSTVIPEIAAARLRRTVVISVVLGQGSAVYARPFADRALFARMVAEVEMKAGLTVSSVTLTSWSAGYGAVREILRVPEHYARVDRVLLVDGLHTDYAGDGPGTGPSGASVINRDDLDVFLRFARDAVARRTQMIVTHSEIFPGTYASTTETADWLVHELGLRRKAVVRWGPMGTQQLSEVRAGGFRLAGYAGNSAPDHVDQLHALPDFVTWFD
jgi:hypothetical protein